MSTPREQLKTIAKALGQWGMLFLAAIAIAVVVFSAFVMVRRIWIDGYELLF